MASGDVTLTAREAAELDRRLTRLVDDVRAQNEVLARIEADLIAYAARKKARKKEGADV